MNMGGEEKITGKYKQEIFISNFNPWFVLSVAVTFILIVVLLWQLQRSSRMIKEFEEIEMSLERASSDLRYHSRNLELTANLAAVTGDLTWQERYEEHREPLTDALTDIVELAEIEGVAQEVENMQEHLQTLGEIEREVFELISHGRRAEAEERLKGWIYTNHQHILSQTIENLTAIVERHIQDRITAEKRLTSYLQVTALGFLMLLMISWYITFQNWRASVKERRRKEEQITYLSFHDPLTDIYNRRYFMEVGEEEIERARRYDEELSLLMLDIDRFKQVNDRYGHPAGDAVLEDLAGLLRENFREVDIPARLGGEEFGILMPSTDKVQALKAAERIREKVAENSTQYEDKEISITVSVGVADFKEEFAGMEEFLQLADKALYRAKQSGRNCTVDCDKL
ncbi:diguanylate cyclase (GGDEF) domain-containing protein [Halarsenatibacter silvermanii]|uniref:Diguanylate cyclase (GGDEF) domain-containing protein n=2 Tax=Halarsenatibacter silvermanii TaxID=321763 RepID=A0A1G9IPJ3_9FIRM|nr:diguanylate cyclase (GGDEF) domain-containing protein [Halarsenatibacter silvermanii]